MNYKNIIKIFGILFLGALGALVFQLFIFPYMLSNPNFENFEFVKWFKEGKIVVSPIEQIYVQESAALENSVEKAKKSVAAIQGYTTAGKLFTSPGIIATSDGLIVTLSSSVSQGSQFNVYINEEKTTGQILKRDKANNLVLIKADKNNLTTVGFFDFDKIKLGQRVFLLGGNSIEKDDWIADQGIISYLSQDAIRTSIWQTFEADGTLLFNIYGELVGINYTDSIGRVWAVPISKIKDFLGL